MKMRVVKRSTGENTRTYSVPDVATSYFADLGDLTSTTCLSKLVALTERIDEGEPSDQEIPVNPKVEYPLPDPLIEQVISHLRKAGVQEGDDQASQPEEVFKDRVFTPSLRPITILRAVLAEICRDHPGPELYQVELSDD